MAAKKTTITRAEYLQLIGLKTLGETHSKMLNEIEAAMYPLLGLDPDDMSAGDVIYGDRPIEWLMEKAGVTLEEEER